MLLLGVVVGKGRLVAFHEGLSHSPPVGLWKSGLSYGAAMEPKLATLAIKGKDRGWQDQLGQGREAVGQGRGGRDEARDETVSGGDGALKPMKSKGAEDDVAMNALVVVEITRAEDDAATNQAYNTLLAGQDFETLSTKQQLELVQK